MTTSNVTSTGVTLSSVNEWGEPLTLVLNDVVQSGTHSLPLTLDSLTPETEYKVKLYNTLYASNEVTFTTLA